MTAWLETFAEPFMAPVPVDERDACRRDVQEALRATQCDAGGRWTADYVRLRFAAVRPTG